jgi:hypothetical protein
VSRKLQLSPDVAALNPGLARALVPGDNPYRSKLEARAVRDWLPGQQAARWWYEPVGFKLPSGRYTPDLMLITLDGIISFVEIKGYTQNIRASRKAFLEAAHTHTWARWCWLTFRDKEWSEEWQS